MASRAPPSSAGVPPALRISARPAAGTLISAPSGPSASRPGSVPATGRRRGRPRAEPDLSLMPARRAHARTGAPAGSRRTRWPGRSLDRGSVSIPSCHARRPRRGRAPARPAAPGWSRRGAAPRHAGAADRSARRASAISVPRPGPSSTRRQRIRRPIAAVDVGGPGADQLAEHLADLGRRDEVALRARGDRGVR